MTYNIFEDNGMIWKAVRHSLLTELLTWVVVVVFAVWVSTLGLHFSVSGTVYSLAMLVVFVWIYWIVSRRL